MNITVDLVNSHLTLLILLWKLEKLAFQCGFFSLFSQSFSDRGILWFAFFISLGQYLNLDKDHNGMLSKEELSRYGTGTLTNIFLDRVFQECLTYDGEMVITYFPFVHSITSLAYSELRNV